MWAVIKIGSKQYKVSPGDIIETERIKVSKNPFFLEDVLLISNGDKTEIGKPLIKGARAELEIIEEVKGRKVIVFKYRRRKKYRRKRGHRQVKTHLKILQISRA